MTINLFKSGKWSGFITIDTNSVRHAELMAHGYFRTGTYSAVNIESASGNVLRVVR